MTCIQINNVSELEKIAQDLIAEAKKGYRLILLKGDLGAGKTTLTQYIAKKCGILGEVTSPTFSIINEYDIDNESIKKMYHLDLYRLKNEHEILALGFDELLASSDLVIVEWPEKAQDLIYGKRIEVEISVKSDLTREVCVNKIDSAQ